MKLGWVGVVQSIKREERLALKGRLALRKILKDFGSQAWMFGSSVFFLSFSPAFFPWQVGRTHVEGNLERGRPRAGRLLTFLVFFFL